MRQHRAPKEQDQNVHQRDHAACLQHDEHHGHCVVRQNAATTTTTHGRATFAAGCTPVAGCVRMWVSAPSVLCPRLEAGSAHCSALQDPAAAVLAAAVRAAGPAPRVLRLVVVQPGNEALSTTGQLAGVQHRFKADSTFPPRLHPTAAMGGLLVKENGASFSQIKCGASTPSGALCSIRPLPQPTIGGDARYMRQPLLMSWQMWQRRVSTSPCN